MDRPIYVQLRIAMKLEHYISRSNSCVFMYRSPDMSCESCGDRRGGGGVLVCYLPQSGDR